MPTQNAKQEEIMKRYLDLPEDVQKALFSTKTSDAIFEIGKKHGLQIDKMGELADETGLVMLGITKPSEYIRNLEKRLSVEVLKAKEVAEDINQKVFSPIRESLKKIHGIAPTVVGEKVAPISPIKPVSPQKPVPEKISPPENLPVETIPSPTSPSLIGKGESESSSNLVKEVRSEKVNQILKQHQEIKQARKHVMPPQPVDIKVGEIAKPMEPKVEVKPMISGRIEVSPPSTSNTERKKTSDIFQDSVPDIFLKKIPFAKPKTEPDFVSLQKESMPQEPKEAKNMLEKELAPANQNKPVPQTSKSNNDPYKEQI